MIYHYILNEQGNPVPEPDYLKWAEWYEQADRQVAETFFGPIRVSTVFLSLPHVDNRDGTFTPLTMLYETMVFADESIIARLCELSETDDRSIIAKFTGRVDIQKRYATKEEALLGHTQLCAFIEVCIGKGLIQVDLKS